MPRKASTKKRPDGFYQRSITVGRKFDGKPIRKTIYAKTLKELETRAADYERQLKHGTLSSNEKMTLDCYHSIRVWFHPIGQKQW